MKHLRLKKPWLLIDVLALVVSISYSILIESNFLSFILASLSSTALFVMFVYRWFDCDDILSLNNDNPFSIYPIFRIDTNCSIWVKTEIIGGFKKHCTCKSIEEAVSKVYELEIKYSKPEFI